MAHEAAASGSLPENFKQWDLADETGWTVAHAAAKRRRLPEGFGLWGLGDKAGLTVRDVFERRGGKK